MFKILIILTLIHFGIMEAANKLSLITWDHAVNNRTKLEVALKSDVQMLEADVQLGTLIGSPETNIPIMAHPPSKISDLSLEEFIINVTEFNSINTKKQKGIKLDFKSIEAFNASITILKKQNINQLGFPVWLNADIQKGPGNPTTLPVNDQQFLSQSKQFPNATLSIGWTTDYNNETQNASYSQENTATMIESLKTNAINQSVTFPVRGVYAANSPQQLTELIHNVSGSTLTVWSAVDDQVNVKKLRDLIISIGMDKVYVDVPEKLMKDLNLNGAPNLSPIGLLSVVLSVLVLLFNFK